MSDQHTTTLVLFLWFVCSMMTFQGCGGLEPTINENYLRCDTVGHFGSSFYFSEDTAAVKAELRKHSWVFYCNSMFMGSALQKLFGGLSEINFGSSDTLLCTYLNGRREKFLWRVEKSRDDVPGDRYFQLVVLDSNGNAQNCYCQADSTSPGNWYDHKWYQYLELNSVELRLHAPENGPDVVTPAVVQIVRFTAK